MILNSQERGKLLNLLLRFHSFAPSPVGFPIPLLELLNLYLFPEKERKDETQASLSSPYREIEQLRPFTVIESENERRETKDSLSDGPGRSAPSPSGSHSFHSFT